jgi:hypothetical protein
VAAALFAWLQSGSQNVCCGDFDGYYHLRWSSLLWAGLCRGHLPAFRWLPLTSLNPSRYADQHFLYHLLLIPFTWFQDLALGGKVAAALFGSFALCSCLWLILRYRIPLAPWWFVALLGSSALFLYRMSMTRAQSLSLIFLMAGIALLFESKYRWLALLAFFYVWTYNLFVVLGLLVLLWEVAGWWAESRFEWRSIAWTAAGMAAGLILNPYFPNDVLLLWQHVVARGLQGGVDQSIGAEWSPISSWLLLKSSFIAFLAMVAGYMAFGYVAACGNRSRMRRSLFMLLLASVLMVATVRWRRFAEYWPATAVLFAAFTFQTLQETQNRRREARERANKGAIADAGRAIVDQGRVHVSKAVVALAVCLLLGGTGYQAWVARQIIATSVNPNEYRGGTQWLISHVPPNDIIFNTAWEDFPKLFYYDQVHAYVTGLDPLYLRNGNRSLSDLYTRIVNGQESHAAPHVRDSFRARYVFVSALSNPQFGTNAMVSGEFEPVYADSDCMVLKVREAQ